MLMGLPSGSRIWLASSEGQSGRHACGVRHAGFGGQSTAGGPFPGTQVGAHKTDSVPVGVVRRFESGPYVPGLAFDRYASDSWLASTVAFRAESRWQQNFNSTKFEAAATPRPSRSVVLSYFAVPSGEKCLTVEPRRAP